MTGEAEIIPVKPDAGNAAVGMSRIFVCSQCAVHLSDMCVIFKYQSDERQIYFYIDHRRLRQLWGRRPTGGHQDDVGLGLLCLKRRNGRYRTRHLPRRQCHGCPCRNSQRAGPHGSQRHPSPGREDRHDEQCRHRRRRCRRAARLRSCPPRRRPRDGRHLRRCPYAPRNP